MAVVQYAHSWFGDFEEWDDEADRWFAQRARILVMDMAPSLSPEVQEYLVGCILADRQRFVVWICSTTYRPDFSNGEFHILDREVRELIKEEREAAEKSETSAQRQAAIANGIEIRGYPLIDSEEARTEFIQRRIRMEENWPRLCVACGGEFALGRTGLPLVRCPECRKAGRKPMKHLKTSPSIETILESPSYEERSHVKA